MQRFGTACAVGLRGALRRWAGCFARRAPPVSGLVCAPSVGRGALHGGMAALRGRFARHAPPVVRIASRGGMAALRGRVASGAPVRRAVQRGGVLHAISACGHAAVTNGPSDAVCAGAGLAQRRERCASDPARPVRSAEGSRPVRHAGPAHEIAKNKNAPHKCDTLTSLRY